MIVYDEKGQEYEYIQELNDGHLVKPVFDNPIIWWADGHENLDYELGFGSPIVLKVIYKEPPIQKKLEEIEQLNKDIKHLEGARDRLKRELDELAHQIIDIKQKELEDVLKDRLKEIPLAEDLIHILLHDYCEYGLRSDNTPYSSYCTTLAVRTNLSGEKELIKLQSNEIYSDNYHVVYSDKCNFKTLEDAELQAVKNLNNKFMEKPKSWNSVKEVDKLFDKHNIERSEDWIKHYNSIKEKHIESVRSRLNSAEEYIIKSKKDIEKYKKELEDLK